MATGYDRGDRPRPTRWSSPRTINVIFMACSSHLGQVLLRERMSLLVLFLNPDDAHTSDKGGPTGKHTIPTHPQTGNTFFGRQIFVILPGNSAVALYGRQEYLPVLLGRTN